MAEEKQKGVVVRSRMDEIAIVDGAITPATMAEAWVVAEQWINGGMVPAGYTRTEHVMIAWQAGAELGFGPQQSLKSFAVVKGKPMLMGEAALGLVNTSGLVDGIIEHVFEGEGDDYGCTTFSKPVKGKGITVKTSFTIKDAKRAGLWDPPKGGPWKSYPKRMLNYRSLGFHLKDYYPEALQKNMLAEEATDLHRSRQDPTEPPTVHQVSGESDPLVQAATEALSEPEEPVIEGEFSLSSQEAEGPEIDKETGEEIPSQEEVDAIRGEE